MMRTTFGTIGLVIANAGNIAIFGRDYAEHAPDALGARQRGRARTTRSCRCDMTRSS